MKNESIINLLLRKRYIKLEFKKMELTQKKCDNLQQNCWSFLSSLNLLLLSKEFLAAKVRYQYLYDPFTIYGVRG